MTGVVFGGVTFPIGKKTNIILKGCDVLLYDRKTEEYLTAGSLEF